MSALKDADAVVWNEAAMALEKIMGRKLGQNLEKWRQWWEEHKNKYQPQLPLRAGSSSANSWPEFDRIWKEFFKEKDTGRTKSRSVTRSGPSARYTSLINIRKVPRIIVDGKIDEFEVPEPSELAEFDSPFNEFFKESFIKRHIKPPRCFVTRDNSHLGLSLRWERPSYRRMSCCPYILRLREILYSASLQ